MRRAHRLILIGAVMAFVCPLPSAHAGDYAWRLLRPSNSGLPGELIHKVAFAPNGKPWVGARHPFWQEGGIGELDVAADAWTVWSNWETPIPSEYINDIEFHPDGAAWIATDGGLVRFDGETWQVWNAANSPLAMDRVANVSIAPDGHVWINNSSFNAGGDALWDFDGVSQWEDYRVPDDLPWEAPWTDLAEVFVAGNGHVWTANDVLPGVAEFDGSTWTLRGTALGVFGKMAEDHLGNIWINANTVGGDYAFYRWDGHSFTTYPFYSPTTLARDPDSGTIYFGNWGGEIWRTPDGGETMEVFLTGLNIVFSIAPDPNGTDVWVGTIGAVGHFTGNGVLLRDYNSWNTGIPDYFIDRFAVDRDGFFWVATGEAGLSRFDGTSWRNWGNHNAGSEPYPFAGNEPMGTAYQDAQGTHWFGGNGIARWDSETGQFTGFWNWQNNPGMGVTMFTHFAQDVNGDIFAATEYGQIYRFNGTLWEQAHFVYSAGGFPGMATDSADNLWVAGWFDINLWDGTEWTVIGLPYPDFFFDLGGINAIAIGPGDVLWFATGEGLVRWDGVTFDVFDTANSPLPCGNIRGLDVRDDGLIGLSCYDSFNYPYSGGCAIVDGDPGTAGSWTAYLYGSSPLPHWQVGDVRFDANGDCWISATSMGAAIIETGAVTTPGDLNGDGVVGTADLLALLSAWGPCGDCGDCPADLDGDCRVGTADLLILLAGWG